MSETKRRRPSNYSKKGCRECKRRKIKCDEGKPHCGRCVKLSKECSYPHNGERVLRVSSKYCNETGHSQSPLSIQLYQRPGVKPTVINTETQIKKLEPRGQSTSLVSPQGSFVGKFPVTSKDNVTGKGTSITRIPHTSEGDISGRNGDDDDTSINGGNITKTSQSENLTSINSSNPAPKDSSTTIPRTSNIRKSYPVSSFYDYNDLNLLGHDLNNFVSDIMSSSNFDGVLDVDVDEYINEIYSEFNKRDIDQEKDKIPINVPLDSVKVNSLEERKYLANFYYIFAHQMNPWGKFYPELNIIANPIRDTILTQANNAPFLRAMLLAQGAMLAHKSTGSVKDKNSCHFYLSTCLRLLEPELSKTHDQMSNDQLASNIESILITVLLLTASNAAATTQNWRPHLKGAKDLILRSIKTGKQLTKTFIICKHWFLALELLAGISTRQGGTVSCDEELDCLINVNDPFEVSVLQAQNVFGSNGFNIFLGYHNDCIYYFRDLVKILNKKRSPAVRFVASDTDEYVRLLSCFYVQLNYVFVDKLCILNSPGPNMYLVDKVILNNQTKYISWMDVSQKCYAYAAIITILKRLFQLPFDSPQIQGINNKLLGVVMFMNDCKGLPNEVYTNSILMIQWPMLVAGRNCIHEGKELIRNFFTLAAKNGAGSAEIALHRLTKLWDKRSKEEVYDSDEDSDLDVISY
jgi:hypothetical protein